MGDYWTMSAPNALVRMACRSSLTLRGSSALVANKLLHRQASTSSGEQGTSQEEHIRQKLENGISTKFVSVKDISGGCGSMYEIYVASDDFQGLTMVKQHKKVKGLLADEIAEMHGLTLKTMTLEKHEKALGGKVAT